MMLSRKITIGVFLLLLASDILETCTQLCFKKSTFAAGPYGMDGVHQLVAFLWPVALSFYLWVGLFLVFTTFIVWSTVLSKIDLSVAVPVASSSYLFVPLVSIVFLKEHISLARWLGILCILVGVIFVSQSSKEKRIA